MPAAPLKAWGPAWTVGPGSLPACFPEEGALALSATGNPEESFIKKTIASRQVLCIESSVSL